MKDFTFNEALKDALVRMLDTAMITGYLPGDRPLREYVGRRFTLVGWTIDHAMQVQDICDEAWQLRDLFGHTGVCLSAIASEIAGKAQPLLRLQFAGGREKHVYRCDVVDGDSK